MCASQKELLVCILGPEDEGERLDKVLARHWPGYSRTTLQRWIEAGCVEVDGRVVSRGFKATAGSTVQAKPLPEPRSSVEPQDIPIDVLFEDEDLIVVNKAAGMVVHPSAGHPDGTLVNALVFRGSIQADAELPAPAQGSSDLGLSDSGVAHSGNEPLRPGIVHRLDKDTSGILVVAKNVSVHAALALQFRAHTIEREYLAIVCGVPKQARMRFDTLHGRHPVDRKRFSSKVKRGKRAVTHIEVVEGFQGASLVSCRLETGRTHQIRVHLSDHGHPILGDPMYGRAPVGLRDLARELGRQALHARVLGFDHPVQKRPLRFLLEPPGDFVRALEHLRSQAKLRED